MFQKIVTCRLDTMYIRVLGSETLSLDFEEKVLNPMIDVFLLFFTMFFDAKVSKIHVYFL